MTRLAKSHKGQAEKGLTILTLAMAAFGFVLFYFGSQAVTPEDAHLIHWASAAAGALVGWLIAMLVERFVG